jgi:signal transduction histidine kinase
MHWAYLNSIALAVLAVVALVLGWYVAGRMLRPLRIITATARRISATNLDERLCLPGPNDELKELGDTIDELLGRLQRSWASQRQFIANVSHELRSPLTRLRLQADIAATDPEATVESLQSGYQAVIATTQQQEELIAALLSLAKGQRGVDQKEPVDLGSIVQEVLRAQRRHAERCGLHMTGDIAPAIIVADPRLIKQLVSNLLDNAIVHNTPGGMIHLVTITEAGNGVFSVSNDGPMIPPTELKRLFRPFERLEPGRHHHKSGHGLGLSIIDAIADAHGASIAANSRPQGGLSIEVTFPPTFFTLSPEGRAGRLTLESVGGYALDASTETGDAAEVSERSVGIDVKFVDGAGCSGLDIEGVPVGGCHHVDRPGIRVRERSAGADQLDEVEIPALRKSTESESLPAFTAKRSW